MIQASPFDSEIFRIHVGRAALEASDALEPLLAEARTSGFDVVFVRTHEEAPVTRTLADRGLFPLETLVTLKRLRAPVAPATRFAIEHHTSVDSDDAAAVAALTADAITISHFHADPRLPPECTRRLYATWATNDVTGRAQRTILARGETGIAGYLTACISSRTAVIDLVAVDPVQHSRGIGSALLTAFLAWSYDEGLDAQVGTQSTNRALQLYQQFGFVPSSRQLTYHLWMS